MFDFHDTDESAKGDLVLTLTLPNGIPSEYQSKIDVQHCTFASDIIWSDESLCATVHSVPLNLALFLIKHKVMFNVSEVIIVEAKESGVAEFSLLDGKHIDPLEYIALLSGEKNQTSAEEEVESGDDYTTEG